MDGPAPVEHADLALFRDAPDSVTFRKLRKRLARQTADALGAYGMVPKGHRPKWLVCLSGGKDSYAMLAVLLDLRAQGHIDVDLVAANLDQGQPGFPQEVLPQWLSGIGVPHRIEYRDTYSTVVEKTKPGQTLCTLCSRLRRGNLYRLAREEGCEAILLGHHRDDILETFLMNLFHGGRLEAMPPKLRNEEGDLLVLRPLSFCAEADLAKFADLMAFPIIPCTLCGSQEGMERQRVKALLDSWEAAHPGRRETMFRALQHARPSHLLDPALFDFMGLRPDPS